MTLPTRSRAPGTGQSNPIVLRRHLCIRAPGFTSPSRGLTIKGRFPPRAGGVRPRGPAVATADPPVGSTVTVKAYERLFGPALGKGPDATRHRTGLRRRGRARGRRQPADRPQPAHVPPLAACRPRTATAARRGVTRRDAARRRSSAPAGAVRGIALRSAPSALGTRRIRCRSAGAEPAPGPASFRSWANGTGCRARRRRNRRRPPRAAAPEAPVPGGLLTGCSRRCGGSLPRPQPGGVAAGLRPGGQGGGDARLGELSSERVRSAGSSVMLGLRAEQRGARR